MGNDYPSAGPITAASLGQKQARIKERTEASYPASNHPLALGARSLTIPPTPLSDTSLSIWSIEEERHNHRRDSHSHHVMEDGVGPAVVMYESEYKHCLDILFIHLSLFKKTPRHLQPVQKY